MWVIMTLLVISFFKLVLIHRHVSTSINYNLNIYRFSNNVSYSEVNWMKNLKWFKITNYSRHVSILLSGKKISLVSVPNKFYEYLQEISKIVYYTYMYSYTIITMVGILGFPLVMVYKYTSASERTHLWVFRTSFTKPWTTK